MSKYYKAEDVINTLADQWRFEQVMEYPDTAEDIEEWKKVARALYATLPTIDIVTCDECRWKDYCMRCVDQWSFHDDGMVESSLSIRFCSEEERKDNE